MATRVLAASEVLSNSSLQNARSQLVAERARAGLYFDFDGVLSEIQEDADSVQPLPGTCDLLEALTHQFQAVSILSSRPASFLLDRFGTVNSLRIFGLYGLETVVPGGLIETNERALAMSAQVEQLREVAKLEFSHSRVEVEDKRLSVGLHYRKAPSEKERVIQFAERIGKELGLKVQPGRMAVELKPDLGVDKGTSIGVDSASLSNVWYFGDDLGDIPAFESLKARREVDPSFSGTCIGVGNDTVVDEVLQASDFFVDSPTTLSVLLSRLAEA